MLLVPFIGVLVSGLQILSDLWSTVSPTSFLPCKFINSFKRQHQSISFLTSTFFYYFVKPSGIPAEEALGYMVICMKNLRTKVLLMVLSVIGFRRFLLTVSTNASTRTSVSWATVPTGSDLEYQWHHLFYCHCLAHSRGFLPSPLTLPVSLISSLFTASSSALSVLF